MQWLLKLQDAEFFKSIEYFWFWMSFWIYRRMFFKFSLNKKSKAESSSFSFEKKKLAPVQHLFYVVRVTICCNNNYIIFNSTFSRYNHRGKLCEGLSWTPTFYAGKCLELWTSALKYETGTSQQTPRGKIDSFNYFCFIKVAYVILELTYI